MVPYKFEDIAEALGRRLNLPVVSISPEEAPAHFGFLSHFTNLDCPTGVAVDGSFNVYLANWGNGSLLKLPPS